MADKEVDEERDCHNLLTKLKKTTESLLAGQSVKGAWGTYGGLRRVCTDTEAILGHRMKENFACSESDGSFWNFAKGLKWLSPSLTHVIGRINRYSQAEKMGATEAGRAWLQDSVQDHSLVTQLDILVGNQEHLHHYYYDDAFLCQNEYVQAMKICLKAIELNKPALLTDINPHLLRSPQTVSHSRTASLSESRSFRGEGGIQSLFGGSHSGSQTDMGNRHPHLNVTYMPQLSSSNMSLSVDPSLGVSSHLQKNMSGPYLVSSLDSPRILENLSSNDPLSEAYRNIQASATFQSSGSSAVHPQEQIPRRPQSSIFSNPHHNEQFFTSAAPTNNSETEGLLQNKITSLLPQVTHESIPYMSELSSDCIEHVNKAIISPSHTTCALQTRHSSHSEEEQGSTHMEHLKVSNPDAGSHSSFEDVTAEAENLQNAQNLPVFPISGSLEDGVYKAAHLDISSSVAASGYPVDVALVAADALPSDIACSTKVPGVVTDLPSSLCMKENATQHWSGHNMQNTARVCNSELQEKTGSHISVAFDAAAALNVDLTHSDEDDHTHNFTNLVTLPSKPPSNVPNDLSYHNDKRTGLNLNPQPNTLSNISREGLSSNTEFSANFIDSLTSSSKEERPTFTTAKSDPSLFISDPLDSKIDSKASSNQYSHSERPWAEVDLYSETKSSPSISPNLRNRTALIKSSGNVYIPAPLSRGASLDCNLGCASENISIRNSSDQQQSSKTQKLGHKRWVSDTSAIQIDVTNQCDMRTFSKRAVSRTSGIGKDDTGHVKGQGQLRASELEASNYHGTLTKPTEGQSLMSYLTSQDFKTCANLEKENAHFLISEALIAAFESMKWNRTMQKQVTGRQDSSSSLSSDEEIQELRQRIRIRKREKMMEKGRPFPSLSDGQTDTVTTSQSASSPVTSLQEFSSMSGSSESADGEDTSEIDLTMSSDAQGNLSALRSSGLTLSMASLYSDAEIKRSNQQIEKNISYEESGNSWSAESIAISLLRKFSEKHLPKASELKWLVSERDAPQCLLPLPASIPVSPDDGDTADIARTRLRGNLEWAPPRAQIIFSVHPTEKRAAVMARQNYRCSGCGLRVDPTFMKRYRYCEYLGKYFCQCCHTGESSIIPGRVIERWDFSRYPVSTFSFSLLEKMWKEPLFHIDTINPGLYKKVRALEVIRDGRKQLLHLHSFLDVCKRDTAIIKEMQKLPTHWISNDDAYAMEDFIQVKNGAMQNHIKSFISLAIAHVHNCQLCKGLGFFCEMCNDQQAIFPFQLDIVIKCQVCRACYHKECFVPEKCPKCIRMEARRKREQEILLPDSPDSGENENPVSQSKDNFCSSLQPLIGSADGCG